MDTLVGLVILTLLGLFCLGSGWLIILRDKRRKANDTTKGEGSNNPERHK